MSRTEYNRQWMAKLSPEKLAAYKANHNALTKTWTQKRRASTGRFLNAVRSMLVCIDCGSPDALQFDHREGTVKLFDVGGAGRRKPLKDLIAEIEKCDPRCGSCHATRHHAARRAA